MLHIRESQLDVFGHRLREAFIRRMITYVATEFPDQHRDLGEAGTRQLIEHTIETGRRHAIETEGGVAVLLQLTLMFGQDFERSPDAAWANDLIATHSVPESLRMRMIRERLTARTQGRSIVRYTFPEAKSSADS
jgi:hypothetical protein